jgi:hypothetical protein
MKLGPISDQMIGILDLILMKNDIVIFHIVRYFGGVEGIEQGDVRF